MRPMVDRRADDTSLRIEPREPARRQTKARLDGATVDRCASWVRSGPEPSPAEAHEGAVRTAQSRLAAGDPPGPPVSFQGVHVVAGGGLPGKIERAGPEDRPATGGDRRSHTAGPTRQHVISEGEGIVWQMVIANGLADALAEQPKSARCTALLAQQIEPDLP